MRHRMGAALHLLMFQAVCSWLTTISTTLGNVQVSLLVPVAAGCGSSTTSSAQH